MLDHQLVLMSIRSPLQQSAANFAVKHTLVLSDIPLSAHCSFAFKSIPWIIFKCDGANGVTLSSRSCKLFIVPAHRAVTHHRWNIFVSTLSWVRTDKPWGTGI
jgi:hypothetical protein